MAFDVNAALSSGYSPNEVADYLGKEKGFDAAAARQSGYTDDEIIAHLSGPSKAPAKEGIGASLRRGAEQLVSSGQTALESVTKGGEEAARRAQERQSDIQSRLGEGASLERLKDVYNQQGILAAAKELGGQIPSAIAEQVPGIAATLAGAGTGAAAGSLLGPVGTVVGGIGGAFAPSFVQQYGGNIQRQAEAQQAQGKPLDISRTAAAGTALPQAGLDVIGTLVPLGGNIVSKILGPTIGKMVTAGGSKIAEEALLTTITKGTLKGIAAEVPTEVTQQMLERAQAGLPLTTEDALREYGETAFAVSLLGPIGIIGRVSDKAKAGRDLAAAQQAAAAANEPQQVTIQTADSPEPVVMYVSPTGDVSDSLEKLQQAAQFKKYYEDQNAPAPVPVSQTTEAYAVPGDKEAIMAARMEEARASSPAMQKLNDIVVKKQQFLAKEQAVLDEMKAKQSAFTNAPMEGGVIRPPSAEEIAAQEAKTASYANRVTVAAQENGKLNIYEGQMNPSGKTINVIDPVTGAKKTFNPKQKNIVVDPTEKDIFAFEQQGLTTDLKTIDKEIKDAEKAVSGQATNFEEWIKKNPIKESEIADVLPSAMQVRSGGKGTKIAPDARKFFSKKGSAIDDLALRAVEDGVMTQEELDSPGFAGGTNAFLSKLEAAYNKETIETPENRDAIAQIATLYNQKEQLEQEIENQKALAAAPTEEEIGTAQAAEFVPNEPATPAEAVTPAEYAQREPVTPSFRAEVPYEFSPQAKRDMAKIIPRITQTLDRMGLRNIGLNLAENLKANVDGKITKVNGTYLNRIITLCLDNRGIEATLHHEAIHALKEMGMFSQKEWATLSKIAKDKWIDQYNINSRYPNASPEVKIEEAIASAFPDYMKQVGQPRGLLQRIKDFVQRVGNVFRGFGYNSPESVFAKAEAGKLTGEGKAAQATERAAVPTNTENFRNWFGDSKVVNEDGSPKVVYHGTDKPDFSIFDPASWFTENTKEASAYAQTDILRKRERLLNKYTLSEDTSAVGKTVPFGSVLSDIGDLKVGEYYAEGGFDGPVYKYLGKNKYELLKNVVVDLDSADLNDMTIKLKEGQSEEAINEFNETKEYANEFVGGEGGRVYPVYLSIKNPLYLDAMQANSFSQRLGKSKEDIQKQIDEWKAQGYDGIITTSDEARFFPEVREAFGGEPAQYIPFDSNQIKSVIGNKGTFSKDSGDIRAEVPSRAKLKAPMQGVDPAYAEKLRKTFTQEPATVKQKMEGLKKNFFNRMVTGLFDEFRAIKQYDPDAYMMARLSKSIDGGLQGLLEYGQVYIKDGALDIKANTKGLLDILAPVGAEVDQYQIWKALNRDAALPADKRSLDKDLVAGRDNLIKGDLNGKPRKAIYEQALREENELNKSVLKIAKDLGLIDQAGYDKFASDIYYIPFYKMMEDGDVQSVSNASKLTGQQFSKALKGGEKQLNDLMENVLMNWSHILSAAMKNQAATKTIDAAAKMGAAKEVKPMDGKYPKGSVKVMKDGKAVHYELSDPDLVDAISTISYLGPKSQFLDVAKGFTNALRYGITMSPAYKVRNLIRDSIQSAAISELGNNMFKNVYDGLAMSKDGNPTFMAALAGGGIFEMGTAHEGNQAKLIKRLVDKGVNANQILDTTDKIKGKLQDALDWYNEQGNKFENANRLALYKKLIDSGKTHLEASYAARDLMDFSMQGQFRAVKIIGSVVPFFNARLQGLYKLGRDGVSPTYRVIANATTGKPLEIGDKQKAMRFMTISSAVMLASLSLYEMYKDDEDFKRREDWDRDNFWWFKIGDTAFRIPKPFEIGALGTIAERTLEQISDENVEGKVFAERLNHILMDTFSLNPTPQMVKPLIDLYANKDSFTGAPIESGGMQNLSKQERVNSKTSGLAIALGGVTEGAAKILTFNPDAQGVSPVQVDYAIKAYFGWLGATAASTADLAVEPFQEGTKVHKPVIDTLAMGFIKTEPETQSKYMTQFYQNNANLQSALADMRHYAELGDSEKVQKIYEERGQDIALAKVYDKTSKAFSELRKQSRLIENMPNIPAEEKRAEMNRIKILMSDMAEQMETMRKQLKK